MGDLSKAQPGNADLIKRLRRAKANGDPSKYIAGVTVADAHGAADALEAAERVIAPAIVSAKLLAENSRLCVERHHGHSVEAHGLPPWLRDCNTDIDALADWLARHATGQRKGGDDGE